MRAHSSARPRRRCADAAGAGAAPLVVRRACENAAQEGGVMKRAALALFGTTALLLAGCRVDESADVSPPTDVEIASSPAAPYAGYPMTVTVTAHNDRLAIRTVAVDFTDDGTLDE